MITVGHFTQEEFDALPRKRDALERAAFATLRSPDLPDMAIRHRGAYPVSAIQSGGDLSNHLEVSYLPNTHLIHAAVSDRSQSAADQTLEAYLAAAAAQIAVTGPPELSQIGGGVRLRTSDYRQEVFVLLGAAGGVFATIIARLIKRPTGPPLHPASSTR
jgi:hypothetical protein